MDRRSFPMADPSPTEIIQSESTCSICLEFFTDPVVLVCDHNYCRACIKQCLKEPENGSVSCPQCRHTCLWDRIKPNRLLVSVVEAAKQMRVREEARRQAGSLCEVHDEELKLYCHEDEKLICTVCDCSREHRRHSVLPVEEAAVDYKKSFQHNLVDLKSKLDGLLACRRSDDEIINYLKTEIETQRTLIKSELESLHMLLYEQEEMLLGKLEAAETSISVFDTKILTKRSEKIDRLNELILTIEASCQKPAKELMKDAKDFLTRIYEELHEKCNTTVVQSEGGISGDKCDASTYPRIYNEVHEWRNITVPPSETEVSTDQHGASTCTRIYNEVHEWRNITVPPCETEVSTDQHGASTCTRTIGQHSEYSDDDLNYDKRLGELYRYGSDYDKRLGELFRYGSDEENEKAAAHQRNPPKKSNILKRMRKILLRRRSNSDNQQAPGDVTYSHAGGRKAKVMYDYEAEEGDELSIVEGDIITDIVLIDEGWSYGVCNRKN